MLGVLADNHDLALALDDLALLAHGLHGRSYFHDKPPCECLNGPSSSQAPHPSLPP